MKKILTLLLMSLIGSICLRVQVTITNTSDYYTMEQMLLANEINESGTLKISNSTNEI